MACLVRRWANGLKKVAAKPHLAMERADDFKISFTESAAPLV